MFQFDDQIRRNAVGDLLCPDNDYEEKIGEFLKLAKIPIGHADLSGHRLTIHETGSNLSSSTTYTSIKGLEFAPHEPSLSLHVNCLISPSFVTMLEFTANKQEKFRRLKKREDEQKQRKPDLKKERDVAWENEMLRDGKSIEKVTMPKQTKTSRGWLAYDSDNDSRIIPANSVQFNGQIRPEHQGLLRKLRLLDKCNSPLGQPMSFVNHMAELTVDRREIQTRIESLTILTNHQGKTTVIIIPTFCCYKLQPIKFFKFDAEKNSWSFPGNKMLGQVIMP